MKPLLLDSGVFLAARDQDDRFHVASREVIEGALGGGGSAYALDLTLLEVANVATVRWRSTDEVALLRDLVLTVADRIVRAEIDYAIGDVATLAAAESISVYDAAYAHCARRHGWQLVSTDVRDLVSAGHALDPVAAREENRAQ